MKQALLGVIGALVILAAIGFMWCQMDARLVAIEGELAEGEGRLSPAERVYLEFQEQLVRERAMLVLLRNAQEKKTLLDLPDVLRRLYEDPNYKALRQQEEQLQANIRLHQRRYNGHASTEELKAQLTTVDQRLKDLENELAERLLAQHAQQVENLQVQLAAIKAEIGAAEAE